MKADAGERVVSLETWMSSAGCRTARAVPPRRTVRPARKGPPVKSRGTGKHGESPFRLWATRIPPAAYCPAMPEAHGLGGSACGLGSGSGGGLAGLRLEQVPQPLQLRGPFRHNAGRDFGRRRHFRRRLLTNFPSAPQRPINLDHPWPIWPRDCASRSCCVIRFCSIRAKRLKSKPGCPARSAGTCP